MKPKVALLCSTALLLAFLQINSNPMANADTSLNYVSTTQAGITGRAIAVDKNNSRAYLLADSGRNQAGMLWTLNTTTGQLSSKAINLGTPNPSHIALSKDSRYAYVTFSGAGMLATVDLERSKVVNTLRGLPRYPNGVGVNTVKDELYVYDNNAVYFIDPHSNTIIATVRPSEQKYPLIKDIVQDVDGAGYWISEGRDGVVTYVAAEEKLWLQNETISISSATFDGLALGGRPNLMALDADRGELHIVVTPTSADRWHDDNVVTVDINTAHLIGHPITVGERVQSIAVNPANHDIYTANSYSNSVSVIDSNTWSVSRTFSLGDYGITSGTGAGASDLGAMTLANKAGSMVLLHPYSISGYSMLDLTAYPTNPPKRNSVNATPTDEAPGPWAGPSAPQPSSTPSKAISVKTAGLDWLVNDYMNMWHPKALGTVTKTPQNFTFSEGRGWYNPQTGEADIVWKDGIEISHYPTLEPLVKTTFGNPRLRINAQGRGELTVDVAWSVRQGQQSSGYKRVSIATFAPGAITISGNVITAKPDYEGRTYRRSDGKVAKDSYPAAFINYLDPEMQAWWMSTGAKNDPAKVPNPLTITLP
ncbi:MAG: HtaA domain-containing protein [Corynebacterium sp.]|nr:HtaA domain-containing protein [Corynebacterium sp.]